MIEWKRIVSDRKRIALMFCIPLVCLVLFFYQKTIDAMMADPQEYRALVEEWRDSSPEKIVAMLSEQFELSENEMRLRAQAEYLLDYPGYLDRVQDQAYKMQHSSIFGADPSSYTYRNIIKTAKDFSDCSSSGIRLGYDRSIQDWLAFSWADWGFLAAVLLLVMSFLDERKKGLSAIVRSCPAGRGDLQISRMLILLFYCAGMTLLLYYLPLALSLAMVGGWEDLSRPVQSLAEFQKCTAQLTIKEFLAHFFIVKTACGFLLGVLIWFALSFLEQVQLCWMATAAGLAVEYLLNTNIPAQSILAPLRYVNVFSYVFTSRLYTEYVNINFLSYPVGKSTLLIGLLITVAVMLSMVIAILLPKRYPFGNRDRLGKWLHLWNRAGDALRRRLGMIGFEWYKLLFLTAGGLLLILGFLFSRGLPLNSGAYNRLEDSVYRQYITQVQGPVTLDTFDYIAQAKAALETSEMDTPEFEAALSRLEQTVNGLPEGAWLVDETMFLNIYGSKSWYAQRNTALVALLILCACLSPLFSAEQNSDLRKVLRSTPYGRERLFWTKYGVAFGVTVLVWLMVFVQEWRTASKILGETVLDAPCTSIGMLNEFPGTVRTYLTVLCISKGIFLLIPMNLCVLIGVRSSGFEKALLISIISILIPATAYRFGVHALQFVTPLRFLADKNLILAGINNVSLFAVWIGLSLAALFTAKRNWCSVIQRS